MPFIFFHIAITTYIALSQKLSPNIICRFNSQTANNTEHTFDDTEKMRRRLYYQSKERGMLENELLLITFAKKYLFYYYLF